MPCNIGQSHIYTPVWDNPMHKLVYVCSYSYIHLWCTHSACYTLIIMEHAILGIQSKHACMGCPYAYWASCLPIRVRDSPYAYGPVCAYGAEHRIHYSGPVVEFLVFLTVNKAVIFYVARKISFQSCMSKSSSTG